MRIRQWVNTAIDFCFPGNCVACREECEGSSPLCAKCLAQLNDLATAPKCSLCAMPLAYANAPCPYCRGEGHKPFERIAALGTFSDPLKGMIHAIKYQCAWPLAEYLVENLAERLTLDGNAGEMLGGQRVIVPVPLHPWRRFSRGFNQADVISVKLIKKLGAQSRLRHALVRIKATETQTHLHSRAARAARKVWRGRHWCQRRKFWRR